MEKHSNIFHQGEIYSLDEIYKYTGLLPIDSYYNINERGEASDTGDNVMFKYTVWIEAKIKCRFYEG